MRALPSLLVLAALAGFAALTITAPFGKAGLMADLCVYDEIYAQSWDDFGFWRSWGVPMVSSVGDTVRERLPYAHMAPAGWWWPYFGRQMLGRGHVGYKLFPTLFAVGGALVLWWLVRRRAGDGWALVGTGLWIACPTVLIYAGLPGVESVALLCAAVMAALWLRWRAEPSRGRAIAAGVWFIVGCQMAWPFYFVAPGILLAELIQPRDDRKTRGALALFPLGVVGFALVVLHLVLGVGDVGYVLDDLARTVQNTAGDGLAGNVETIGARGDFLGSIVPMSALHLGPLGAPLFLLTLVVVLARRRWREDPVTAVAAIMLGPGLLSVIIFNGRSSTHGYYYFLLGAPFSLFLVQGARMVAEDLAPRIGQRLAILCALALLGLTVGVGVQRAWPVKAASEADGLQELATTIDALVPADTWIYCHDPSQHGAIIYSERRWLPPLPSLEFVEDVLRRREAGRIRFGQLLVIVDTGTRALAPHYVAGLDGLANRPGARRQDLGHLLLYWL
jgi:hypothetical protein